MNEHEEIKEYVSMMEHTSREKAIEALREVSGIVSHPEHDSLIADIAHELSKPTIDDAIKVVEKMHNKESDLITMSYGQVERSYHRSRCGALYEVLTALKGLKEAK